MYLISITIMFTIFSISALSAFGATSDAPRNPFEDMRDTGTPAPLQPATEALLAEIFGTTAAAGADTEHKGGYAEYALFENDWMDAVTPSLRLPHILELEAFRNFVKNNSRVFSARLWNYLKKKELPSLYVVDRDTGLRTLLATDADFRRALADAKDHQIKTAASFSYPKTLSFAIYPRFSYELSSELGIFDQ